MSFKRLTPVLVTSALLVGIAACGGGSPTPAIGLSLSVGSIAVPLGGEAQVTVTLTRTGSASEPVVLTLEPATLPDGVTYSFTPGTLSGAATTSVLKLAAAPPAEDGPTVVQVKGTSGALEATRALTFDVESLALVGHVVSLLGTPLANVTAQSQGKTAVTNAAGNFYLAGLAGPYDLTLSSAADVWTHVYEGLTGDTLTFLPDGAPLPSLGSGSMQFTGSLSGGSIPVPASHQVRVCAEGVDAIVIGCTTVAAGLSAYSLTTYWFDGSPQVRLHAFEIELDGDKPVDYIAYGTATATVVDGVAQVLDLTLGAGLSSFDYSVEATVPTGYPTPTLNVLLRLGDHHWSILQTVTSTYASVKVPVLDGVSASVLAGSAVGPNDINFGWGQVTTTQIAIPDTPVLGAPPDAATNVTSDTAFSAGFAPGQIPTYVWGPQTDGAGPTYALTTTRTDVRIPAPDAGPLALPPGIPYEWVAYGVVANDVDHATTSPGRGLLVQALATLSGSSWGFEGDGGLAMGESREFTTAP